jgi:hydrogenase small subunit
MELTRREFVRTSGAVTLIGFSLWKEGRARGSKKVAEVPLVWLSAGACGGCAASFLESASRHIEEGLLARLLPGKRLSLAFHTTVMAAAGDLAMRHLARMAAQHRGRYLLVVEGAPSIGEGGRFCQLGGPEAGRLYPGVQAVTELAQGAKAVLAIGTCAAFGGVAATPPNPTGAVAVSALLRRANVSTPVVNIPGCPPHPDWIVGTVAAMLLGGALPLDALGRPKAFFSTLVHDACPFRGDFDRGRFAEHLGQRGCLLKLGCKGPVTFADCPVRQRCGAAGACMGSGHPCIGCTRSDFPFARSLFAKVEPAELGFPTLYPETGKREQGSDAADTYVTIGLLGAGGFAAGVGVGAAIRRLRKSGPAKAAEPHPAEPQAETREVHAKAR